MYVESVVSLRVANICNYNNTVFLVVCEHANRTKRCPGVSLAKRVMLVKVFCPHSCSFAFLQVPLFQAHLLCDSYGSYVCVNPSRLGSA